MFQGLIVSVFGYFKITMLTILMFWCIDVKNLNISV